MSNNYIIPTATIKRSEIELFEKNPRTITKEAYTELKKSIKKWGVVGGLIYNKRTGRLVGGHQKIAILDEIHKGNDYEVSCSVVDLSEKDEIKLNIILNNPSIQGEYDVNTLSSLIKEYEIDLPELHFNKADIDYLFNGFDFGNIQTPSTYGTAEANSNDVDKTNENTGRNEPSKSLEQIKQAEKEQNARAKIDNRDNENRSAIDPVNDDYKLTFVFLTNKDKRDHISRFRVLSNYQSKENIFIPAEYFIKLLDMLEQHKTPLNTVE